MAQYANCFSSEDRQKPLDFLREAIEDYSREITDAITELDKLENSLLLKDPCEETAQYAILVVKCDNLKSLIADYRVKREELKTVRDTLLEDIHDNC